MKFLKQSGLSTEYANIKRFHNSTEIGLSAIARLNQLPYLLPDGTGVPYTVLQLFKSIFKQSQYTKEGLIFELLRRSHAFMKPEKLLKYKRDAEYLKKEIIVSVKVLHNSKGLSRHLFNIFRNCLVTMEYCSSPRFIHRPYTIMAQVSHSGP